jgi:hypothetical protein
MHQGFAAVAVRKPIRDSISRASGFANPTEWLPPGGHTRTGGFKPPAHIMALSKRHSTGHGDHPISLFIRVDSRRFAVEKSPTRPPCSAGHEWRIAKRADA